MRTNIIAGIGLLAAVIVVIVAACNGALVPLA